MTQVLRVGKFSGKYEFLDKEAQVISPETGSGLISSEDADVLLERIRQGYQYIPGGHYILRLEDVGGMDGYFEFTEMITFDTDDDGYAIPRHTQLVTQAAFDAPFSDHNQILTANAFIDYAERVIRWMNNPIGFDQYVYDPAQAVKACDIDDDVAVLMTVGARYLMRDKPTHYSLIPTRFYVR
ncbi:hypothetical protein ST201phi2-1p405 [Pseudomonas phage 201phi2-1]|uniref:Uncharacterized protein n=1 Tax=Pseudomonas phage 201phi2-1 TaxID=198110 RepID=B3FJR4_BP201|nr:hypothetical protein ST201phi2-1p405 [Pseudomonas phage 201phi2-1]ABY63229.1 hypothetical protein 201phi2-1p405 [Pseudomonas phage 201phi2-1]